MDTGDRTVYLAEVVDACVGPLQSPLTATRLLELAPADKLRTLKEALTRDAQLDRDAILQWRQRRGLGE